MNTNVNLSAATGVLGLPGALATEGGVGMPLDAPPRPGESYATGPVFEPPEGARARAARQRAVAGHGTSQPHCETGFGL